MSANEGSANPPPAAEQKEFTILIDGQEFTFEFDLTLRCHDQEPSPPPGWPLRASCATVQSTLLAVSYGRCSARSLCSLQHLLTPAPQAVSSTMNLCIIYKIF
ncbi:hypothetical protein TKK_0011534 [Trichogramma kaykai]